MQKKEATRFFQDKNEQNQSRFSFARCSRIATVFAKHYDLDGTSIVFLNAYFERSFRLPEKNKVTPMVSTSLIGR